MGKTVAGSPALTSAAKRFFRGGGSSKRIRPVLVFLVSRATAELTAGTKGVSTKQQRLAEIIEMIHAACLLHHDILDQSHTRIAAKPQNLVQEFGSREPDHQLYDRKVAVLVGDLLFAQSLMCLADLENLQVMKLIGQVIKDTATGGTQQASSVFNRDIKLEEYLHKSFCKKASVIAAAAKSAAIFSQSDRYVSEQMYEFGKNLGLSFQIVDDVLDITQPGERLGKQASVTELVSRNLTAPLIFAMEEEPRLREIVDSASESHRKEAFDMVKIGRGIEKAAALAKEKADLALMNLSCLPSSPYKVALEEILLFNLERIR